VHHCQPAVNLTLLGAHLCRHISNRVQIRFKRLNGFVKLLQLCRLGNPFQLFEPVIQTTSPSDRIEKNLRKSSER
jgi:hypothetical protein